MQGPDLEALLNALPPQNVTNGGTEAQNRHRRQNNGQTQFQPADTVQLSQTAVQAAAQLSQNAFQNAVQLGRDQQNTFQAVGQQNAIQAVGRQDQVQQDRIQAAGRQDQNRQAARQSEVQSNQNQTAVQSTLQRDQQGQDAVRNAVQQNAVQPNPALTAPAPVAVPAAVAPAAAAPAPAVGAPAQTPIQVLAQNWASSPARQALQQEPEVRPDKVAQAAQSLAGLNNQGAGGLDAGIAQKLLTGF